MKRIFLFFFLFICLRCYSVDPTIPFRYIDTKAGLSDNYVKDILRDKWGFCWIATSNGLNRYDGYQIKEYYLRQAGGGRELVSRIMEDGGGHLWVIPEVIIRKLYTYDRVKDRIVDNGQQILNRLGIREKVNRLYIDDCGNLWASTDKRIYCYNYQSQSLSSILLFPGTKLLDITGRKGQTFAMLSDGNVYRIDIQRLQLFFEVHVDLSEFLFHYQFFDSRGNLWFYTAHSPIDGIQAYSTTRHQWLKLPSREPFSEVIVTSVTEDHQQNIWISTESDGLFVYNPLSGDLLEFMHDIGRPFSLPSNHITRVYQDGHHNIWIGTSNKGVAFTNPGNPVFRHHVIAGKEYVNCIEQDRSGNLWLGFDGYGVAQIKRDAITFYNKKNGKLPTDLITCNKILADGTLLIGTFGEGIMEYKNGSFQRIGIADRRSVRILTYSSSIEEDKEGTIWVGTFDCGLVGINKNGDYKVFGMSNSEISSNSVLCQSLHQDGTLYMGTDNGVNALNTKLDRIVRLNPLSDLIGSKKITAIHTDSYGYVWIGWNGGLAVYWPQDKSIIWLTDKDGLSGMNIVSVCEDGRRNVWVATSNGLNLVKREKDRHRGYRYVCYPFYTGESFEDVSFQNNSVCRMDNGQLLFGCVMGYICVPNAVLPRPHNPSKVVFSSLWLRDKLIEPDDSSGVLEGNIQLQSEIVLSHDQNDFSLTVSSMEFAHKKAVRYLYRFRDSSKEWTRLPGNRISFHALPPGEYNLEVMAVTPEGSSKVSAMKIRVTPPYWKSGFAVGLYALLAILLLFFLLRGYRKKQKRIQAHRRMEMEMVHQHEMEESKMRFFTNVSHDLKTRLSLVIMPLERLMKTSLETDVKAGIELSCRNAKLLLDQIVSLLDFRKLDVGSEELRLTRGDIVAVLDSVSNDFLYYAKEHNIRFEMNYAVPSQEMDFDNDKVRRVFMNILSNAFKYNRRGGCVSVTVDTMEKGGQKYVKIDVADTGLGIAAGDKERIFERFYQVRRHSEYVGSGIGLHIVREYVKMHHGEITVSDNTPCGSIFTIRLPILHYGEDISEQIPAPEPKTMTTGDIKPVRQESSVLIVEDNKDFRDFLVNALEEDYVVLTACNGEEALHILSMQDTNVSLVVSDIMMPVMDGLTLCQRIKTDITYSHVPVILLTAKSMEENIIEGLSCGADDYITKPFSLDILKLRIRKIQEWSRENHKTIAEGISIEPQKITITSLDKELVEKAIKYVEDNMSKNVSVEDFSAYLGMSRTHLYKKLLAITGKSPIEFIRLLKIKRSRDMLEQGCTNIAEVAYRVGLNPKLFSKYFKDEYGLLPSDFVRQHRSD